MTTRSSKLAIVFTALIAATIAAPISASYADSATTSPSAMTSAATASVTQQAIMNGSGDVGTAEDGRFFVHKPVGHFDIDDVSHDHGW
ncbi:MAG TPA: hypothetical protein VGP48_12420 [Stellaceae bacterium]|jgi:hypothetical protein|nr:hypothetical protein [Stellaceae bacterium]